ncbi:MAG TPA: diguanylate cyclase [Candidatus Deferrimicrobiaceae bacterium]|jgi:diguanylate cyclase (GGDEF)-like protein
MVNIARILVLQEEDESSREFQMMVYDRPIEFEFRPTGQMGRGEGIDISRYCAVIAPVECAERKILDALGTDPKNGPMIFLYRGEPPLREAARWVAWTNPAGEGENPALTDRLLSESLEYYSLASLYQQCLKIMTSQDDDKVLAQITDTFVHELGAESCVIWMVSPADPDEMMIASVRGAINIDKEGSRFFLSQSDISDPVLSGKPFLHASSVYVPLIHQEKPIGLVKLGERLDRKPFEDRDLYVARIISDYAASALKMVERLFRMEKISLRDPETRAYSAAFLEDYLEKERYKAGRFRRPLSVIFLVIDNFHFLMEKTRESLLVGALGAIVESIRKALRDSDLIARIEPNRFCIVLPETDAFGAVLTVRRLRKAVREQSRIQYLGTEFRLQTLFLSATYPQEGRDFPELLQVVDEKYGRLQKSPLHRLHLSDKSFWDAFDVLVGKPEYYDQLRRGEEVPYFSRIRKDLGRSSHFCMPRESFLRMVEAVAQDVVSAPAERGLVIAAGPTPEIYKQIFLSFGPDAPSGRNIYLVGQSGSTRFDARNLLYVTTDDDHLRDREFLFYLKENGAYGLFASNRKDEVCGFNTADEWLVEAMMEKVQDMYLLQGNF